jgi:hypothetical protein
MYPRHIMPYLPMLMLAAALSDHEVKIISAREKPAQKRDDDAVPESDSRSARLAQDDALAVKYRAERVARKAQNFQRQKKGQGARK